MNAKFFPKNVFTSISRMLGKLPQVMLLTGAILGVTPTVFAQSTTFNADGSYVVPAGVTQIQVTVKGGGGAGAGADGPSSGGSGGSGAQVTATVAVTAGETLTVTIGRGGRVPTATANQTTSNTPTALGGVGWFAGGTGGQASVPGTGLGGSGGGGGGATGLLRSAALLVVAGGGGGGGGAASSGGANANTPGSAGQNSTGVSSGTGAAGRAGQDMGSADGGGGGGGGAGCRGGLGGPNHPDNVAPVSAGAGTSCVGSGVSSQVISGGGGAGGASGVTSVTEPTAGGDGSVVITAPTGTFWDGTNSNNTSIEGGNGTWDATTNNWTVSSGTPNGTWAAGTSIATFSVAPGTVNVSGTQSIGGLTFTTDGYTLSGGSLNGAAPINTLTAGAGINATVGSVLTGGNAFDKADTGTINLTGANTYSGATTVSNGTLVAGSNTALGATTGGTTVASGATLALPGGISIGIEGITLSGTGVGGVGALSNTAGANTYGGDLHLAANGSVGSTAGTLSLSNTVFGNGFGLTLDGAGDIIANGGIVGAGTVAKTGSGTALLKAANSYSGATTVSGGTLVLQDTYASPSFTIASGAVLELNRSVDTIYNTNTTFTGAGTLRKTGAGRILWGNVNPIIYSFGAGSLIDVVAGTFTGSSSYQSNWTANLSSLSIASGATFNTVEGQVRVDALNGAGTVNTGYDTGGGGANAGLTVGVNNGSGIFTGVIQDLAGAGVTSAAKSFTKVGSGTQTLTGANTYIGVTAVNAGTLMVNGNQASATGAVNVASGATLGGSGTLGGFVTINSGGILSPGNSPGAITVTGLSLPSGSNLNMELGAANVVGGPLNDRVQDNGALSLGGGTLNITVPTGGSFTVGTYRLIDYTGTRTGTSLVIGTTPAGFTAAQFVVDTSTPNQVNLIVSTEKGTFWDVSPQNDSVVNGGTGTWMPAANTGSNTNWTGVNGASNGQWLGGTSIATFAGTAGAVTVSGMPDMGGLTFTTDGYTLSGGTLNGMASINTLTAGAGINATVGSVLAGTTAFDKAGVGVITLTGANTYTGNTTVSNGTLVVGSNTALGAIAGGTTVASGATLALPGGINITNEGLTLSGTGVGGVGALSNIAGANGYGGFGMAANTTIGSIAGTLTLTNVVGNSGFGLTMDGAGNITANNDIFGAGTLTKTGSGTALFKANTTYSGATTVSGGTLGLQGTYASPSFAIASGAVLELNRSVNISYSTSTTFTGSGILRKTG